MTLLTLLAFAVVEKDGSETTINTPGDFPNPSELMNRRISAVLEPMIRATIIAPDEYTGPIMQLCAVSIGFQPVLLPSLLILTVSRNTEGSNSLSPISTERTVQPSLESA